MANGDLVTPPEVIARWPGFAKYPPDVQAAMISDASAIIQNELGITFAMTEYTELLDGKNYPRIWVTNKPVLMVISVKVNGDVLDDPDGVEWTLDPQRGELLRGAGQHDPRFASWWPSGRRNIEVVYMAGYDPIPEDVKRATVITMQSYAAQMTMSGGGIYKSEEIGDYKYTLSDMPVFDNIPATAMAILGNYQPDLIF